jgi:hypothetical protein
MGQMSAKTAMEMGLGKVNSWRSGLPELNGALGQHLSRIAWP